jgi:hypothetical protein
MEPIRKKTVVRPGGLVEVSTDELPVGTAVEVSLQTIEPPPQQRLRDLRGSGRGVYSSPEDVDAYIRSLRDEWDS